MDGDLVVIDGRNSSGKTSLAESLEWLFTGSLSRRESKVWAIHGNLRIVSALGALVHPAAPAPGRGDHGRGLPPNKALQLTGTSEAPKLLIEVELLLAPESEGQGHVADSGWPQSIKPIEWSQKKDASSNHSSLLAWCEKILA